MSGFRLVVLFVCGMTLARVAGGQATPPTGSYTMTLSPADSGVPGFLYGTYTLALGADRSYRIVFGSDTVITGKYTTPKPGLIVLTDLGGSDPCPAEEASGAYTWTTNKDQLVLRVAEDPCRGRQTGLSQKPWRRSP